MGRLEPLFEVFQLRLACNSRRFTRLKPKVVILQRGYVGTSTPDIEVPHKPESKDSSTQAQGADLLDCSDARHFRSKHPKAPVPAGTVNMVCGQSKQRVPSVSEFNTDPSRSTCLDAEQCTRAGRVDLTAESMRHSGDTSSTQLPLIAVSQLERNASNATECQAN